MSELVHVAARNPAQAKLCCQRLLLASGLGLLPALSGGTAHATVAGAAEGPRELEINAPASLAPGADGDEQRSDFVVMRGSATAGWKNLRGPHGDGSAASDRAPASLELAWKHSIGPGYSGVAVAGGRAVTAFSDGEHDVVAAWSTTKRMFLSHLEGHLRWAASYSAGR